MKLTRILLLALVLFAAARPGPARAAVIEQQQVFFQDDFDSCTGERVLISGVQRIVSAVTTDAAGRTHFTFTRSTTGSGVGYDSGARYIMVDTFQKSSLEVPPDGLLGFTQVYQTRLVRQGETAANDDTRVHFLTRLTFTPDGQLVTTVEIQDVSCQ